MNDYKNGPSQPMPHPKLLLSARETAEMLSISARLLWTKTKSGEIPSVQLGRRVLYSIEKLRAWLESHDLKR